METAVERAVRLAGGQSALARAVGVTPQAVQQWVTQGRISYRKVIDVERVTGVPRYELRPDLYPAQEDEALTA
jgi:DNA-binding transcriptional regulator YdaS (Cro superfamily)